MLLDVLFLADDLVGVLLGFVTSSLFRFCVG